MTSEWFDCTEVFDYISEYSTRQLTFESDRLDALLGVLEVLAEHRYPVFHLRGIPLITSTTAPRNCWGPQQPRPTWPLNAAFMLGMTWNVQTGTRRNLDFPSWSWISWTGSVGWGEKRSASVYLSSFADPLAIYKGSVWIKNKDGSVRALEEYEGDGKALGPSLPRIIYVESDTVEVTVSILNSPLECCYTFQDNDYAGIRSRSSEIPIPLPSTPLGHYICWDSDSGIKSYAAFNPFDVTTTYSEVELYKVLVVALSSNPPPFWPGGIEGKLLRRTDEGYEVCGHVSISLPGIFFKPPEARESEVPQVTKEMILPKMAKERGWNLISRLINHVTYRAHTVWQMGSTVEHLCVNDSEVHHLMRIRDSELYVEGSPPQDEDTPMTGPQEEQCAEGDESKGDDVSTDPEILARLTEKNPLFNLEDEKPERRQRS
ncbi:hypothetical protein DL98DRAFT_591106 [Cadophora sp. DSE1049]|nr:hypothetical protein DL98DRAFT_591106 [Cadophora sp. DSE1049]